MVKSILFSFAFFLVCFSCASDGKSTTANDTNNKETEFTKTIPPSEFLAKFHAQPGAVMVDVRTPKEFVAGRILPEAVNVDYHSDAFLEEILALSKDDPIYVYCFSGGRSSKAAYKMRQLGFDRIYECAGGFQRWEKENKK